MITVSHISANADLTVGYVYKWTNLVNGMMYVGSHNGNSTNYKAGGITINQAFKKFGMDSFTREILYVGPNFLQVETEILCSIDAAGSSRFYNLTNNERYNGNSRTFSAEALAKMSAVNKGRKHTAETRANMSSAQKGKKLSDETRAKMSATRKGKPISPESVRKSVATRTGSKRSEESKLRMSWGHHQGAHVSRGRKPVRGPCRWCDGETLDAVLLGLPSSVLPIGTDI